MVPLSILPAFLPPRPTSICLLSVFLLCWPASLLPSVCLQVSDRTAVSHPAMCTSSTHICAWNMAASSNLIDSFLRLNYHYISCSNILASKNGVSTLLVWQYSEYAQNHKIHLEHTDDSVQLVESLVVLDPHRMKDKANLSNVYGEVNCAGGWWCLRMRLVYDFPCFMVRNAG